MGGGCFKSTVVNANTYSCPEEALTQRRLSRSSERKSAGRRASYGGRDGSFDGDPSQQKAVQRQQSYMKSAASNQPQVTCAACTQGGKDDWLNQDSYIMIPKINGQRDMHLFGVFDGHGEMGKEVSNFVKRTFPTSLFSDRMFPNVPLTAFKNACETCTTLLRESGINAVLSGCTCCCVLFMGQNIYTCNVGDSRSVLGFDNGSMMKILQLTVDHTAENVKERARIIAAGGRIIKKRIYCADSDVPGLIPSRSIGDFAGKKAGIVCTPDVGQHKLDETVNFIAVMSDGVWENVPGSIVGKLVNLDPTHPQEVSKRVVAQAWKTIKKGNKYKDDMTVVIVMTANYGKVLAVSNEPTDTEVYESGSPKIEDEHDRVAAAIEHCEHLIDEKSCHPDDALDSVAGLNTEERYKVQDFLHKYRKATAPTLEPPLEEGARSKSTSFKKALSESWAGSRVGSRSVSRRGSASRSASPSMSS